ncbi:MAG: hypothetical protein OHK0013_25300 [Sandaracinaceae bacterium]
MALAVMLVGGCRERGAREICGNGGDDDGNGAADCADVECASTPVCVATIDAGPTDAGPIDARFVPVDVHLPDSGLVEECGPVDVVFVLDVSTSMEGTFDALRAGIRDVWDTASRLSPDPRFSLIVFVDDALAVDGCAPFGSVDGLSAAFDRWRSFCSSNASPVSMAQNYDFPENSLDALYLAATACTFREGATRVLVHVTDDTFYERPAIFSGEVPAERTFAEVSRALTAFQLRVASFHDMTDHPEGFSAPYRGAPSLVDATGGRGFSFDDVVGGRLDMGDAIQEFLVAEYCTPYLI